MSKRFKSFNSFESSFKVRIVTFDQIRSSWYMWLVHICSKLWKSFLNINKYTNTTRILFVVVENLSRNMIKFFFGSAFRKEGFNLPHERKIRFIGSHPKVF